MIKKTTGFMALLISLMAVSIPVAAQQTPSGIEFVEMPEQIDAYVAQHIGQTTPGLAVVVVSNGDIIFSKGYGYADLEAGIPVSPTETVFEYGSVSKLFVYSTLVRLAEEGQLDLSADIRTYLPDGFLRHLRFAAPISLLDVMHHQAGFEDMLLDVVVTRPRQTTGMEALLRSRQPKQVYRPATVTAYSNFAVALAAYIAENKLGEDFHAYLRREVFKPLGMNQTTIHPLLADQPELMAQRARGYAVHAGSFKEIGWSYIPLYPVGAANGTAEDLARYALALMPADNEGTPLFREKITLNGMFRQTLSMGPGMTGFAHGFIEYDSPYRGMGHGGNTAGFSAQFNIIPELRFGVVVLANAAGEMDLTEGVTRLLLGDGPADKPAAGLNDPDPAELSGRYLSARRPHTGFLKLYGFLGMLTVQATGPDSIQVSFAGQSASYVQTQPFLYEQTAADGPLFNYHFRKLYFEPCAEKSYRISGDFLPLPPGHTLPWLAIDAVMLVISLLFFCLVPPALFFCWRKKRRDGCGRKTVSAENGLSGASAGRSCWPLPLILASGFCLLLNNGILVVRMLMDNYRSYTEVSWQLALNYPLLLAGAAGVAGCAAAWKKGGCSRKQRMLCLTGIAMWAVLSYLLLKWQFFTG